LASLEIINDRIGILALGNFLPDGTEQTGWYAYGQRWLDAFKMFASLVGIVLLTYYARLIQTPQKLISLIKFCLLGIFLPISVISIVACLNTTYLTTKLYHSSSDYLSTIFALNILTFVPYSIIYIFQSLFLANGGIKRLNIIFTVGLFVNVLLSLLLIKSYKAVGVSISFLASAIVIAFLQIVFSPVKIKFISIAKFAVKTVFILSSTAAICYLLSNSGIFLQLVAVMVWAMGLVWLLKLFSLSFWHEVRDSIL
jgi:O-antigen/teichoic acid export membrane protein